MVDLRVIEMPYLYYSCYLCMRVSVLASERVSEVGPVARVNE